VTTRRIGSGAPLFTTTNYRCDGVCAPGVTDPAEKSQPDILTDRLAGFLADAPKGTERHLALSCRYGNFTVVSNLRQEIPLTGRRPSAGVTFQLEAAYRSQP
jgi:hypothetical protein